MLKAQYAESLRAVVGGETKSYGFAVVVWGVGSLSTAAHGPLGDTEVFAFVGGVFAAMALTILVTFGGPKAPKPHVVLNRYAVGAIHLGSVAGGIGAGWLLTSVVSSPTGACVAAGFGAVLVYQLLLGLEVAESIRSVDTRLESREAGDLSTGDERS